MIRLCFCIILFLFYPLEFVTSIGSMLGPSDFIFKTLEDCPGVEENGGFNVSFVSRKFNRTDYVYDIDLTSEYDIANSLYVEFKASFKKEGGYKPGAYYIKQEFCEAFHVVLEDVFDEYLNSIGFSECPVPAGSYSVNGFYFNNEVFNVPQVYGEYKTEFYIWKDDKLLRCLCAFYELTPKQT